MKSFFEVITSAPLDGGIQNSNVSQLPDGEFSELPEGLAMAFAQDTAALARFTALSISAQDDVIRRARSVSSRDEMRQLIKTF